MTQYAHRVGLSEGQGALSPRVLFIARLGLGLAAAHKPEAALRLASLSANLRKEGLRLAPRLELSLGVHSGHRRVWRTA